ncbi:MAG: DUF1501 domain-containing protein [Gammaproteobacteria bacterium]|nr:DUF1501 domain-containing protein [Gammaproteobacteria bacterium]
MKRRDFLKTVGLLGVGSALPLLPSLKLYAAHDGYTGPLWITIDARGGWDPTSFCDPKGYENATDPNRINNYSSANIEQVGNFSIAPPPDSFAANTELFTTKAFFQKYFQKLLVVNGIDSQTNSHSDGQRHNWSGELGRKGFPNFGALVAGVLAGGKALPFITNGGYSDGGGLTTPVRIDSRSLNTLFEIAYPNRSQNAGSSSSRNYFSDDILQLIDQSSAARLDAVYEAQQLTRIKSAIEKLRAARGSSAHMTDLADNLEQIPEKSVADFNGRRRAHSLYRQGRIALAAYETGVTASAHVAIGGFDTHSNHDQNHYPRLMDFLQGIDGILQEAKERGLEDRIVVVMGSDFGRTNKYNDGDGKDHWPVTSMMFMGNSKQVISGNRVVGQTTDEHKAINVDPISLVADVNDNNPQSVRITPAYIHRALRKLAGVEASTQALGFGLKGSDIDLFS